jgi:hypothetical protein
MVMLHLIRDLLLAVVLNSILCLILFLRIKRRLRAIAAFGLAQGR